MAVLEENKERRGDTVSTTSDGRGVVDVPRLLKKAHVKEFMEKLNGKIVRVTVRRTAPR